MFRKGERGGEDRRSQGERRGERGVVRVGGALVLAGQKTFRQYRGAREKEGGTKGRRGKHEPGKKTMS